MFTTVTKVSIIVKRALCVLCLTQAEYYHCSHHKARCSLLSLQFIYLFWLHCKVSCILVPQPEIETVPSAVEALPGKSFNLPLKSD